MFLPKGNAALSDRRRNLFTPILQLLSKVDDFAFTLTPWSRDDQNDHVQSSYSSITRKCVMKLNGISFLPLPYSASSSVENASIQAVAHTCSKPLPETRLRSYKQWCQHMSGSYFPMEQGNVLLNAHTKSQVSKSELTAHVIDAIFPLQIDP